MEGKQLRGPTKYKIFFSTYLYVKLLCKNLTFKMGKSIDKPMINDSCYIKLDRQEFFQYQTGLLIHKGKMPETNERSKLIFSLIPMLKSRVPKASYVMFSET